MHIAFLLALGAVRPAMAAGGYFSTGYGHLGKQTAGAVTAVAADAFAGASNPGKLTAVESQYEFGLQILNPNKKIERSDAQGPASIYNFSSNSRNPVFLVPEFAWSRQLDDGMAIGVTVYGNGGLNSEYPDTTGVPGSNTNPEACGERPGNFLTGCGHAGFDLAQLIVAPTVAWEFMAGHSVGVAPLLAVQRFESFGLQGFTALSREPDKFTNNGHDIALGAGLRIGWYGELKPWLSLGAAYASKIYMQDFDDYQGLFAGGSLDIPANYSFGAAFMPGEQWTVAVDVQRIEYGEVNALSNSVLNSLGDDAPLMGTSSGSAFGWDRNQTNYRFGLTYRASEQLTFRAGYAYGNRPNDNTLDATSFSVLTPNSKQHATLGASWQNLRGSEFHFAYSHYFKDTYRGPSAIFPGAEESVTAHVHILYFAWTILY